MYAYIIHTIDTPLTHTPSAVDSQASRAKAAWVTYMETITLEC